MESSFKTSYPSDPWAFMNVIDETYRGMAMPLSTRMATYEEIQEKYVQPKFLASYPKECNYYLRPIWAITLAVDTNPLDITLPSNKSIMEAMNVIEKPRGINH